MRKGTGPVRPWSLRFAWLIPLLFSSVVHSKTFGTLCKFCVLVCVLTGECPSPSVPPLASSRSFDARRSNAKRASRASVSPISCSTIHMYSNIHPSHPHHPVYFWTLARYSLTPPLALRSYTHHTYHTLYHHLVLSKNGNNGFNSQARN
jgi:hypothetical protein